MQLYREILPSPTAKVLAEISKLDFLRQFYLAGGTGLALQLGHRLSEDLDFFSKESFDQDQIAQTLARVGKLELLQKEDQTINAILNGVKVSFFAYRYPLLRPFPKAFDVRIADYADIACMKLDAVANRGTKRDFIDLYFLAQEKIKPPKIFELFKEKYAKASFNILHIKKSLVFFDDAASEPMPKMLKPVRWKDVTRFFEREAIKIAL